MPLSHISLTVSHLPTSTSFYLSALQPLGYKYIASQTQPGQAQSVGFGVSTPDFFIVQETPGVPAGAAHIAFPAPSREAVHDFFHAALKAGGTIHGEPRLRDEREGGGYYSAAVIDFDGNSVEAVYKGPLPDALPSAASAVGSTTRSAAPAPAAASIAPAKSIAPAQSIAPAKSIAPARSVVAPPKPTTGSNGGMNSLTAELLEQARSAVNVARSVAEVAIPGAVTVPAVSSPSPPNESSKTLVGTLLGAAAGAFVAYQMTKSESPPPSHSHSHPRPESEHSPHTQIQRSSTYPPQLQYQQAPSYEYAPVQLALEAPRSGYEAGSRSGAPAYSIVEEESIYIPAASVASSHHSSHSKTKSTSSQSQAPRRLIPQPPSASTIVGSFISPTEVVISPKAPAKSTHSHSNSRTSSSTTVSELTVRNLARSATAPSAAGIGLPASRTSSNAPSNAPSKASKTSKASAPSTKEKEKARYEGSLLDLGSVAPSDSISQVSSSHRSKAKTMERVDEDGSVVTVKPAKSSSGSKNGSRAGSSERSKAGRKTSPSGSKNGSRAGSRERSKAGSKVSRRSERPETSRGSTVTLPVRGSDRDSVRSKGYQSVLDSLGI